MLKCGSLIKALSVFIIALGIYFSQNTFAQEFNQQQELSTPFYLSFEQRVILSYLVQASGNSKADVKKIAKRWKKYLLNQTENMEVRTVVVKNFEQFLEQYRGVWPDSHSLSEDLDILEKLPPRDFIRYVGKSQKVQKQISDYLRYQQTKFENLLRAELPDQTLKMLYDSILPLNNYLNTDLIYDLSEVEIKAFIKLFNKSLSAIPLKAVEFMMSSASDRIAAKLKEIDTAGEHVSRELSSTVKDPMIRIYFSTLIQEYFKRLKIDYKKEIVSQYLGQNLEMSQVDKFKIMIQNSGPIFQKFLQVASLSKTLPAKFKVLLKELQTAVRAVPFFKIEKILENERDNYEIKNFERKALGVGAMNEVHRAKIVHPITRELINVAIAFQKPGVLTKILEDEKNIYEIAELMDKNPELIKLSAPKIAPLIDDIVAGVNTELDREGTIQRQKLGYKNYSGKTDWIKSDHFKTKIVYQVPEIIEAKTNTSKVIVMELVQGESLEKAAQPYTKLVPDLERLIVESLASLWAKSSFLESGFYHSDLHPGNVLVKITDEAIFIKIIDYGMGGVFSADNMKQSFLLGASLELLKANLIAKTFWNLSDSTKNKISFEEFLVLTNTRVAETKQNGVPYSINEWIGWATQNGIKLDYSYVDLQRGVTILNQTLEAYSSKLTIAKIISNESKKSPLKILKLLSDRNSGLTKMDLIKLGWINYVNTDKSILNQSGETYQIERSGEGSDRKTQVQCRKLF